MLDTPTYYQESLPMDYPQVLVEARKRLNTKTYKRKVNPVEAAFHAKPRQLEFDLVERALSKLVEPICSRTLVREAMPYQRTPHMDQAWIVDANDLTWTLEEVHKLRIYLFWESFEELTLGNNAREKWDVLKWIFKPIRRRSYFYGQPVFEWHQNDEPFSFHNCCKAVGMDEDILRDGLRSILDTETIDAVMHVVSC